MARWEFDEAEVEALIAAGDLQKLTGDAANGERFRKKAVARPHRNSLIQQEDGHERL